MEHTTPVSATLNGIVGEHQHHWLFSPGGGPGIRCALGPGHFITPAVKSEQVAAILEASQRFGELQFRDRLVNALFDPKTSEAVRRLSMSAPTKGFPEISLFRAWQAQETNSFEETITMLQKP